VNRRVDDVPDALEILALDEVQARAQVRDLTARLTRTEAERDGYRLLAQRLLHSLRGMTLDRDKREARYARLADEYRDHRARVMATDTGRSTA
jgi:hypothetical protein